MAVSRYFLEVSHEGGRTDALVTRFEMPDGPTGWGNPTSASGDAEVAWQRWCRVGSGGSELRQAGGVPPLAPQALLALVHSRGG